MDNEKNRPITFLALSCSETELLLDEYLDNELSEVERKRFERHTSACENCRRLADDCSLVIRTARRLAERPVPPAVSSRLRARLQDELGISLSPARPSLTLVE